MPRITDKQKRKIPDRSKPTVTRAQAIVRQAVRAVRETTPYKPKGKVSLSKDR